MQATAASQAAPAGEAATPTDPDTEALAADLAALIAYIQRHCNADLFEAVGAIELSLTQIKLLYLLDAGAKKLTVKQGAELVHVSLPAASRLVDDLVQRGFLARHEDSEDRRMKRISLTDAGRAVIHRLNAARLTGLNQFVERLTEDERHALKDALAMLLAHDDIAALRPQPETR
jgi:DNA-binding MarR family transcriptional regulator